MAGRLGVSKMAGKPRELEPEAVKHHVGRPILRDAFISRLPQRINDDDK